MIDKRIGVLGGGQLGKMIYSSCAQMNLNVSFMDKSDDYPAGLVCSNFVIGDITDFDDVMRFGFEMDIITIEIEKVNTEALKRLRNEGKEVYPSPEIVELIQDKGIQKEFYSRNKIPTSEFTLVENETEIKKMISEGQLKYPFVQKARMGGYDGQGVAIIQKETELNKLLPVPSVIEEMVNIEKEIAVLVCRNANKELSIYDPVEMVFDPKANLLDYQLSPADITKEQNVRIHQMALDIAVLLDLVGLLAIELFIDMDGNILVNEMAPRPHNSGHHTIEACYTSQYENLLRSILNRPLGRPDIHSPSILINLLGSQDYNGETIYGGIDEILQIDGTNLHLYGKKTTKPFRKMGHVTIVHEDHYLPLDSKDLIKKVFKTAP